jgi:arsenate reductase
MAEGLLRHLAGDRFQVYSAGTHPSRVHPMSIAVMSEIGIDISSHTSDPIDSYLHAGIDIVITVCDQANRLCPTFPGEVERIHWGIDDPFRNWDFNPAHLKPHRETRNIIQNHIEEFLKTH